MSATLEWSEKKIRQKCIEGTKKQLQAYVDNGHVQLNGFPLEREQLSGVTPNNRPKEYTRAPLDLKNPPSIDSYLCDEFTGESKMREVEDAVCEKHRITMGALIGQGRSRELIVARRELFYICYFKLGKSTAQIGKRYNRDHTTIVHHLQVCVGKRNVNYFKGGGMHGPELCG